VTISETLHGPTPPEFISQAWICITDAGITMDALNLLAQAAALLLSGALWNRHGIAHVETARRHAGCAHRA